MRLLFKSLLPLVPLVMLVIAVWRWITRAEPACALGERLGQGPAPGGPSVWLHGASNGELASARWVLSALLAERPGLQALVTCNTTTARDMVQGWNLPGVTAAFAPLDFGFVVAQVLRRWRPSALITVEAEIYPRRFTACARAKVPIALIGARMSERSFQGWLPLQPVMARALGAVSMASAQDAASAERLVRLGLSQDVLRPICDLKAVAMAGLAAPQLAPREARARWLLAASTHDGEEAAVLEAFAMARDRFDHLILAPRHPRRADEVAALISARRLAFARRSAGGRPGDAPVFLADTMGEMDLWYARCGACFVGGSLVPKGGHSPWEPSRFACALLHGPSTSNFAAPFALLAEAGGALAVLDAQTLGQALGGLDAGQQEMLSAVAAHTLGSSGDGTALTHAIVSLASV